MLKLLSIILLSLTFRLSGQTCPAYNYTESLIPAYTLPDPLTMSDSSKVTTVDSWKSSRRPELLKLFATEMYGVMPGKLASQTYKIFDNTSNALNGLATRRQVTIYFNGDTNGPKMDLLVYLPGSATQPVPVFLAPNFWGNHAINADTGIRLNTNFMDSSAHNVAVDISCVKNHLASEACRGINAGQWPVDTILQHGYGLATFYRGDIDPDTLRTQDTNFFKKGVYALFPELQGRNDNFSTIGAWAWALSRALDYLQTDTSVDPNRVAVLGWSRLGKSAVWAGANDGRFAMTIGDASGAGGIALSKRMYGEDICRLNTKFPGWYCTTFKNYTNNEDSLPFDQHELVALIAPRPVFASTAVGDSGSDPKGEFLSLCAADTVYRLFGLTGITTTQYPAVNVPVLDGLLGFSLRPGKHDLTLYDWQQYIAFADKHLVAVTSNRSAPVLCNNQKTALRIIHTRNGHIISGVKDNNIAVFSISGKLLCRVIPVKGTALIPAFKSLSIVKTDQKTFMLY